MARSVDQQPEIHASLEDNDALDHQKYSTTGNSGKSWKNNQLQSHTQHEFPITEKDQQNDRAELLRKPHRAEHCEHNRDDANDGPRLRPIRSCVSRPSSSRSIHAKQIGHA
jgi:hypothetical protein